MREEHAFRTLSGHRYCQLITFRKSGVPVPTPVWFALAGGRLYVKTESPSGKVRRIRKNARVEVAPCTVRGHVRGEKVSGRARILDATEAPRAERVLRDRYGLVRRLFGLLVEPVLHLRGLRPVYLEVVAAGAGS